MQAATRTAECLTSLVAAHYSLVVASFVSGRIIDESVGASRRTRRRSFVEEKKRGRGGGGRGKVMGLSLSGVNESPAIM